jgi:hypothetical protein
MSSVPAPADSWRDEDPARPRRDPAGPEEQEAWLGRLCELDDNPFYGPGAEGHFRGRFSLACW